MSKLDGNLWLTIKIMERIKELDIKMADLEDRYARNPRSKIAKDTLWLTRKTHEVNVQILREINPDYYQRSQSTLIRQ